MLVGGEAGVGKTTLVRRFCADHRRSARMLWGSCEALRTPRPLEPLLDIAASTGGELPVLLKRGAQPHELLDSLLSALRVREPAILVLEDLHWADEATLDLLRLLGRRVSRTQTMALVTYRDDELDSTHPLRLTLGQLATCTAAQRLRLPPLSSPAVQKLAQRHGFDGHELHRKTGGNPFFVTEVLAAGGARVPETVRDAVLARTARLTPDARAVLDAVAVAPSPLELWFLETLAGRDSSALARPLHECLAAGMLAHAGSTVFFRHELARHAIEDSIPPERRRSLHRTALDILTAPPGDTSNLALLTHHAEESGEPALVLRFATAAAERAVSLGAHREAAAQYGRALRYGAGLPDRQRAQLLEQRAYECYLTGEITEALASRHEACARYEALGDTLRQGDQLRWLARLSWLLGREDDADRQARTAVTILEGCPPGRELAQAYSSMSQLRMLALDAAGALEWGHDAIDLATTLGDTETVTHALNNVGTAEFLSDDPRGKERLERSLQLATRHGLVDHVARAYFNLGWVARHQRAYATAGHYLERGITYAEEHDLTGPCLHMYALRACVELDQGNWARAAELAEHVLRHHESGPRPRVPALVVRGLLRARRGEHGAREPLDEALELTSTPGLPSVAAARAEAAWLRGKPDEVAAAADVAGRVLQGDGSSWAASEMAIWRHRSGLAIEAAGQPPGGRNPFALEITGAWREAHEKWEELGCPYEAALALGAGDEAARRESCARLLALGARAAVRAVERDPQAPQRARAPRPSTRRNPANLTDREIEVLDLLTQGLRNAQIAERLVVSAKTVDHHVSAILRKLGARSRGEAGAKAARLGLLADGGRASHPATQGDRQ